MSEPNLEGAITGSWRDVDLTPVVAETVPEGYVRLMMLTTIDGSLNGRDVETYKKGVEYVLPDQGEGGLPDVFVREGWAEEVKSKPEVAGVPMPAEEPSAEEKPRRGRRNR